MININKLKASLTQLLIKLQPGRTERWTWALPLPYIYGAPKIRTAPRVNMMQKLDHHQDRLKTISTRLRLKVSKRARRMTLRLDPESRHVHLIVPPRADLNYAFHFAEEHRGWIRAKLSGLPKPIPFIDGAIIPLFGRDHYLEIIQDSSLRATRISIKNRIMTVETPLHDAGPKIEKFLRALVTDELSQLATDKAAQIRRRVGEVRVRDTRSRWGSCAEDGNLSFCWRIVFAPREVIDYVVAHEVAHLVHFDHSVTFWRLCDRLAVDGDYGRDWLKENGQTLMCYGRK